MRFYSQPQKRDYSWADWVGWVIDRPDAVAAKVHENEP